MECAPRLLDLYSLCTPQVSVVRYEDLVRQPSTVQEALGEWAPFEYDGKFEDFHTKSLANTRALNGVRPVSPATITKWKQHPTRIREQFIECPELFDYLESFGYEPDRKWFNQFV